MAKCIFNDQLVDEDKASIKLTDLALLRGYGIFDFFRLERSVPLFIEDHIDRFFSSANFLRLPLPFTKDELKDKIGEMLKANKMKDSGVRLVLTGGESPNGYLPGRPTFFATNEPLHKPSFDGGIKLISMEYQRDLPEVKSTNYLMGIYKLADLRQAGPDDLLYCSKGNVLELTRSNFFLVTKDDTIVTPEKNILQGITRKRLISAIKNRYPIEERELPIEELKTAKEAFITGTGKKVVPVAQIDGKPVGSGKPGPLTKILTGMFQTCIEKYCADRVPLF